MIWENPPKKERKREKRKKDSTVMMQQQNGKRNKQSKKEIQTLESVAFWVAWWIDIVASTKRRQSRFVLKIAVNTVPENKFTPVLRAPQIILVRDLQWVQFASWNHAQGRKKLSAKLLDYFLWGNKSNINESGSFKSLQCVQIMSPNRTIYESNKFEFDWLILTRSQMIWVIFQLNAWIQSRRALFH